MDEKKEREFLPAILALVMQCAITSAGFAVAEIVVIIILVMGHKATATKLLALGILLVLAFLLLAASFVVWHKIKRGIEYGK